MTNYDKSNERISGLTFKPVKNVRHAVSHAERTELCDASYLLEAEDRLANSVVFGGGRENEITELFYKREAGMSRQAKRAGTTPFWEGVAVLPRVEEFESVEAYHEAMSERLMTFKGEFERATGCSVLLISIHLDEGEKDPETGIVQRNPHAHILIDRTVSPEYDRKRKRDESVKSKRAADPDRRLLWQPTPSVLSKVQTLCSESLQMQRGSTLEERGGKPARKHIDHKQWRELQRAAKAREAELVEELADAYAQCSAATYENDSLKGQKEALSMKVEQGRAEVSKAAYNAVRAFFKGTGKAKQHHYQRLKELYESGSPAIQKMAEYIDRVEDHQLDSEAIYWAVLGHDASLLTELREPSGSGISGADAVRLPQASEAFVQPLKLWKREDEDLYLLPEKNAAGKRLAFVDGGSRIKVKMALDPAVIEQAIRLSLAKWPDGFEIFGPPEFVRLAEQACAHLGVQNYEVRERPRGSDGPIYR